MSDLDTAKAADLYNGRYDKYGRDVRTVGWGSPRDQWLRFEVLFRGLDPRGKTILDVGCGLGDLVPFLDERTGGDFIYVGLDIADRLIDDARATHGKPDREFVVGDLFGVSLPPVDIAVLSGALSLNIDGIEAYAIASMREMFALSSEAASLNFLSKYADFELEKNKHYDPGAVFAWGKKLSKRVNLYHDYPLYEFTVQVLK